MSCSVQGPTRVRWTVVSNDKLFLEAKIYPVAKSPQYMKWIETNSRSMLSDRSVVAVAIVVIAHVYESSVAYRGRSVRAGRERASGGDSVDFWCCWYCIVISNPDRLKASSRHTLRGCRHVQILSLTVQLLDMVLKILLTFQWCQNSRSWLVMSVAELENDPTRFRDSSSNMTVYPERLPRMIECNAAMQHSSSQFMAGVRVPAPPSCYSLTTVVVRQPYAPKAPCSCGMSHTSRCWCAYETY